jgi:hypothetical protein
VDGSVGCYTSLGFDPKTAALVLREAESELEGYCGTPTKSYLLKTLRTLSDCLEGRYLVMRNEGNVDLVKRTMRSHIP